MRATPLARLILIFAALLASLVIAELGLRAFGPGLPAGDEMSLGYRYDSELGWFPIANSRKQITASRTITAVHNSLGFRSTEPVQNGASSVVFLGDSLVWGFDVEAPERFTDILQAKHPEWIVHNLGVSGYGTDQEYLVLQKFFDRLLPRVVFLVICGDNDNEDNSWNFRGGYYKPWFTLEDGHLKLNGVPVPRAERTFLADHKTLAKSRLVEMLARLYFRAASPSRFRQKDPPTGAILLDMRKYVTDRGAYFAVGLQHSSKELEDFLRQFNIPFVTVDTTNSAHTYHAFGNHWTPEGQAFVADKIGEFLAK
jgi:lysophospholipase L1-like esterase